MTEDNEQMLQQFFNESAHEQIEDNGFDWIKEEL